jgi:hypothetical protein
VRAGGAEKCGKQSVPVPNRADMLRVNLCSAMEKILAKNANESQVFGSFIQTWDVGGGN